MHDRYYDRKKSSSHLSGGCAIVIMTGKKSSSCLSGGCAITTISTTGPIYAGEIVFGVTYLLSVQYSCTGKKF